MSFHFDIVQTHLNASKQQIIKTYYIKDTFDDLLMQYGILMLLLHFKQIKTVKVYIVSHMAPFSCYIINDCGNWSGENWFELLKGLFFVFVFTLMVNNQLFIEFMILLFW